MPPMNDEFYIGYQPKAPAGLRSWTRAAVAGFAVLALGAGVAMVTAQQPFAKSLFEFGVYRGYEGQIVEWPYPMLVAGGKGYLLVDEGKFGAAGLVKGRDGRKVKLEGSLIRSADGQEALEIRKGSMVVLGAGSAGIQAPVNLGRVTLRGEIVDTKCHFGVMNPGSGKVHRDCAVRCISGGIPAGLLVRDASGMARTVLLATANNRPIGREILALVAEPVIVTGELERLDAAALVLRTDAGSIRRE